MGGVIDTSFIRLEASNLSKNIGLMIDGYENNLLLPSDKLKEIVKEWKEAIKSYCHAVSPYTKVVRRVTPEEFCTPVILAKNDVLAAGRHVRNRIIIIQAKFQKMRDQVMGELSQMNRCVWRHKVADKPKDFLKDFKKPRLTYLQKTIPFLDLLNLISKTIKLHPNDLMIAAESSDEELVFMQRS